MLAVQFLGEGVVQALVALCVAMMMVELSLPSINAFLQTGAVFDYWHNPILMVTLLAGSVLVGALAGAYPALVLSSFQPVTVLKGLTATVGRAGLIRQLLVGLQFVILIALIAASIIVLEQYRYAIRDALRVDTDQILFVRDQRCDGPFRDAVRALPGVRNTACSSLAGLPELVAVQELKRREGGPPLNLHIISVGYGLFELYGLSPVAGRFFSRQHGGDSIPPDFSPAMMAHYVINQTAVRRMGFASSQAAIGQRVAFDEPPADPQVLPAKTGGQVKGNSNLSAVSRPRQREVIDGIIIGVVRDFSLFPSDAPVEPTAYSVGWPLIGFASPYQLLHVKLRGRDIPETLAAIDALWRKTGADTPIERIFLDSYIQNLMINLARQGQAYAVFAGIATLLACLGLFALSIATAERRTKEIGIRKAMGASSRDIVLLLLWQFLKPVLAAGLIAVPLTWALMQHWLAGYAYHVAPSPWPYVAAVASAVLIATATVITHAILTARAVPATALRYE
jgi:putative ABC transport system permease protein